jgi:hypothetical protein
VRNGQFKILAVFSWVLFSIQDINRFELNLMIFNCLSEIGPELYSRRFSESLCFVLLDIFSRFVDFCKRCLLEFPYPKSTLWLWKLLFQLQISQVFITFVYPLFSFLFVFFCW